VKPWPTMRELRTRGLSHVIDSRERRLDVVEFVAVAKALKQYPIDLFSRFDVRTPVIPFLWSDPRPCRRRPGR